MKETVYIAGPMTGIKDLNISSFDQAEIKLKALGYNVLNPANNQRQDDSDTWEGYMRKAIRQVCLCDIICLLPGWSNSKGALFESKVADIIGAETKLIGDFKQQSEICEKHLKQRRLK